MIPLELTHLSCDYLDYTEASIIESIFDININYEYLLNVNFPAFYEKLIRHINIDNNLRSKDVDLFRETIYESDTPEKGLLKIKDILQSYYIILYRKTDQY